MVISHNYVSLPGGILYYDNNIYIMIDVDNLHIWPGLGADSLQHLGRQPRPRGQGGGLAAGRTLRGEVR